MFMVFVCLCAVTVKVFGQCVNDNVLSGAALTPTCSGTTPVPCVQGGQYALVNVVAGNQYTFSTCGTTFDTQITLYNNTGGASLGYNDDFCGLQSTVSWTATFTGQIRVLVDAYPCGTNSTCSTLNIGCTAPPTGTDCVYVLSMNDSFGDGWGTSYVGVSINGGPYTNYTVATLTNQVFIGVNVGDNIVLNYNNSDFFQNEISYSLQLQGAGLFNSGTPPAAGISYVGIVDCVQPPPAQEDCLGAITICSDVVIANNTTNTGNIVDINSTNAGCLDFIENQGTWYTFSPSVGGDLGFSIAPLGPDDYDWAVWGPFPPGTSPAAICPPAGPPIRCAASGGPATNASTGSYATGMGHASFSPPRFASTAISYGLPSTFDNCPLLAPQRCGWVPGMQVTAGQVFLMYISNWSLSSTGFNLSWTLENSASLDCTVLPVRWIAFEAERKDAGVGLHWTTTLEVDNDHFEIERANDGVHFERIGTVSAVGTSQGASDYDHLDPSPQFGVNYYRLRQVDLDGSYSFSEIKAVEIHHPNSGLIALPNPGSGPVDIRLHGVGPVAFISMLDATGREVMRTPVTNDRVHFDGSALSSGSYVLRALTSDGRTIAQGRWMHE
jgi:hypothetical protein